MPTRRELLQGLVCVPLAARFALDGDAKERAADADGGGRSGRGLACALGEDADARLLPAPRRIGEHIALALAGTARPTAERLAQLTGSEAPNWVELSPSDHAGVDDGPLAERIRTAAGVALIEGPVLDWLVTLWPARRRSAVLAALAECAVTGGRVIGRGSTAFLMASGGVVRGPTAEAPGESRLRLTNPRESGEARMAQGLGLCGDFYVDTQARSQGSLLRLLSALVEGHDDQGVYLGARSALCGDLETRSWTVLGDDPLLWIDLRGARRESRSVHGAGLSALCAGDAWSRRERGLSCSGRSAALIAAQDEAQVSDALAANLFLTAPSVQRAWRGGRARVELRQGHDSSACSGPGDAPLRAQRLQLDVVLARGRWGELGD